MDPGWCTGTGSGICRAPPAAPREVLVRTLAREPDGWWPSSSERAPARMASHWDAMNQASPPASASSSENARRTQLPTSHSGRSDPASPGSASRASASRKKSMRAPKMPVASVRPESHRMIRKLRSGSRWSCLTQSSEQLRGDGREQECAQSENRPEKGWRTPEPVRPQQHDGFREEHDCGDQGQRRALEDSQAAGSEVAGQPPVVGSVQPVEFTECRSVGHQRVNCAIPSVFRRHPAGFQSVAQLLEVELQLAQDPEPVRNGERQVPVQPAKHRQERPRGDPRLMGDCALMRQSPLRGLGIHAGTSCARRSIRRSLDRIS